MAARNHEELVPLVRAALQSRAPEFGLTGPTHVTYRYNPGGFGNANFTVRAGRRVHVKLTRPALQKVLRRQLDLGPHLHKHYRAPKVLGWLELPRWAGLVLEHVPGRPLPRRVHERVLPQLARLVRRLHADRVLQARLPANARKVPDLDIMIRESLEIARSERPAFITRAGLPRLEHEAAKVLAGLRKLARSGFDTAPIHGDIWAQNVLCDARGRWSVIDWDGLALGDPAFDWASLALMAAPGKPFAQAMRLRVSAEVAQRAEAYRRAMLFAFAVDAIADWQTATVLPGRVDEIRQAKERQFRVWLWRWRKL